MRYRKLGRTGLDVSPIALGCMSFGDANVSHHPWIADEQTARDLVKRAVEAGVNFFDTSNIYAAGTSEEVLGRAVRDFASRDEVVIATKVRGIDRPDHPNTSGLSRKAIMSQVDASLRRLGTDHIDLYQIHGPDHATPLEETLRALHDLVVAGKVRYLGACNMTAWEFSKALKISEANGWTGFVSMQHHYNLLHRDIEREMLPLCRNEGIAVLPWSPLARGRLARPWNTATKRSETDEFGKTLYREVDGGVVSAVEKVAADRGASMAEVALAWVRTRYGVVAPIVGASSDHHLDGALAALDIALDDAECELLDAHYVPR